jgi:hypothetical protein
VHQRDALRAQPVGKAGGIGAHLRLRNDQCAAGEQRYEDFPQADVEGGRREQAGAHAGVDAEFGHLPVYEMADALVAAGDQLGVPVEPEVWIR